MSLVSHPNIVSVFGVVRDPPSSTYTIVMEFVEHGSLCSLMKKLPKVPWPVKVRFEHKPIAFLLLFYMFNDTLDSQI